jgi:hypothetical protein
MTHIAPYDAARGAAYYLAKTMLPDANDWYDIARRVPPRREQFSGPNRGVSQLISQKRRPEEVGD